MADINKDDLYLKVITPLGVKFSDYVKLVTIQTKTEGYEGIMKKHIPLCSEVAISQAAITMLDGKKKIAVVVGGFLYNDGDELKILTNYFEFMDSVDRKNVVDQIAYLENKIKNETDQVRVKALNVSLKNEQDKLKAIDDTYVKNQNVT